MAWVGRSSLSTSNNFIGKYNLYYRNTKGKFTRITSNNYVNHITTINNEAK